METIILAGGEGFLGKVLQGAFPEKQIYVLSRSTHPDYENVKYLLWDGMNIGPWSSYFEGAEAVINLAGRSVDCRYTSKNKALIYNSRINATNVIGKAINLCQNPPKTWINVMSATIYRHSENQPMNEETGEIGEGFSVDVCNAWEKSFDAQATPDTRKVGLRTAMVLGNKGGVYPVFKKLVQNGLGGKQGKGNQMVSWIHERDFSNIIRFVLENKQSNGIYNCSAPKPITNQFLMQRLCNKFNPLFAIPTPQWALHIGAIFLRTETELVVKSRFVVPKRLEKEGFNFIYPTIEKAILSL